MEYLSLFLARAMLALVGLLALITPAAADEPLSLSAAINAALARSRSLEASAAAAQGAREMAVAALQAGKHNEFFELSNNVGLDKGHCLKRLTDVISNQFPSEFDEIRKLIYSRL